MNVFIAVLATINLSHQKSEQAVLISCTVQALQQNKLKWWSMKHDGWIDHGPVYKWISISTNKLKYLNKLHSIVSQEGVTNYAHRVHTGFQHVC